MKKEETEGLTLNLNQLQSHTLCGGHLDAVVDGLIFARQNEIDADWMTISMLDLTGRDIVSVLKECVDTRTVSFSTYTANGDNVIQGFCSDGQHVRATLTMNFRLPVTLSEPEIAKAVLEQVQERIATRTSVYIHTSADFDSLSTNLMSQEYELIGLAAKIIPTTKGVRIKYEKV